MSNFTPQQQAAITTIDKNVAVSAGAGSGKTRVLVERFLYILRQGLKTGKPITASEILAITFTRKAAGEMKERLYKSMQELAETDVSNEGFWKGQLQELERAQITTIHGFCNRLLKENPVETGLDPAFTIAEEFEGDAYLKEALRTYLRQGLRKQEQAVLTLTNAYGVQGMLKQLQSLVTDIEEIIAFGDLLAPYQACLQGEPAAKERLCALLQELVDRRNELGKTSKQAQTVALLEENLQEVLEGIKAQPADFTAYNIYVGKISKTGKLKELITEIKNLQAGLLNLDVDRAALPLVEAWQIVLRDFAAQLNARKQQDDFLTYDDLEMRALALLRDNEQVRQNYQRRYRHVMVDEFQDTNDKQKQLVYLLCGDSADELQGSKLFVVGDPKQSIYRFRGADVSVFAEVRAAIRASGGSDITLPDNFRTVDKILDACNEAFAKLLGVDTRQDVYFEPLQPHRSSDAQPVFMQVPCDNETKAQARSLEAVAVAKNIEARHVAGEDYGKMAILLSAMTVCQTLTEALQARGIPYQVVDGKGFYEQQEVLDVLHLLTVLHNRHRSLELAGVLRSPYFGCNDETITKLFLMAQQEQLCLWDALMQAQQADFELKQWYFVERAAKVLTSLRKAAALLALPELLEEVHKALHIEMVTSVQNNGAAKLANVKKLWRLAQEYCSSRQGTLGAWLDYVRDLRAANARETAANLNAKDAVTIMTIHKSKGLEFTTVYLPMLDKRNNTDKSTVKFNSSLGLGVKAVLPDGSMAMSSVLQEIKQLDDELQKAEKQRQLYVAMTRAKDNLIMSGAFNEDAKSEGDNWFTSLKKIFADSSNVECIVEDVRLEEAPLLELLDDENEEDVLLDEEALAPLSTFVEGGQKYFTPTALQTYLHCQRQYFYQREGLPALEAADGNSSNLPPYVIGMIVHRALELYQGDDLAAAYSKAVAEYAPGNYAGAERALQMLEQYIASDLHKSISSDKYRELRFALPADDLFLSGVVDCIEKNADGSLSLIDYKTGRPPKDDEVKLGYAYQLALYKYAVEKLLQQRVAGAKLHFLQNLSTWSLPDDKNYLAEALTLCREISAKGREQDFACTLAVCSYCPYNYLCPQK